MQEIIDKIMYIVQYSGYFGAFLGCLIIFIESIIPVIPLMVFITLNFIVFGNLLGFIISWVFTILGCIFSYMIFKYGFGDKFSKLTEDKNKIKKYSNAFKNISFINLSLLIALPLTPAFMVNIVAGLNKMDFKKYVCSLIVGKIGLVYFWGYVGTSFIESISNPLVLFKIAIILCITYVISLILNKMLKI